MSEDESNIGCPGKYAAYRDSIRYQLINMDYAPETLKDLVKNFDDFRGGTITPREMLARFLSEEEIKAYMAKHGMIE